ncbi:MAG: hypothetical protein E7241_10235 [Lachnospiraceae bacterium]|nr:hypothetical protein [Lachnospiraceae bacterium]
MLLTEYDEELHINNEKDISYREGRIDGLAEGEEERKRLLEENERLLKEIEELKMKDAKYK